MVRWSKMVDYDFKVDSKKTSNKLTIPFKKVTPEVQGQVGGTPRYTEKSQTQRTTPNKRVTPTNRLYMQQTTIPMQLQIKPCTAQVAGHPRMQTWPAQMCATWDTILAANLYEQLYWRKQRKNSGDLNNKLVQNLNGSNMSDHWMVHYSGHGLNNTLCYSGHWFGDWWLE